MFRTRCLSLMYCVNLAETSHTHQFTNNACLKIQLYEIGVCRCIMYDFSGFFLFCVYTRSPEAGKGLKMLRNAKGIVPHEPSMLVSTYTLHCTHSTP